MNNMSRMSFKGWDLKKFIAGRKRMIVTLIGAIAGYVATQNPALSLLAAAVADMLYATIDYYIQA